VRCVVVAGPEARTDGHCDDSKEHHAIRWTHVDEVVTLVNSMFDLSEDKDPACLTQPLSVGSVMIDPGRMAVVVDGKPVDLTPKEFHFLHVLALNSERTCTRDELKRLVWGNEAGVIGRTVDVLVSRLRGKLLATAGREVVETVRGIGYRFIA
jgi:DNA-binding response OmpR family regulator